MDLDKDALYAVINELIRVPRDVSDLLQFYVHALDLCVRFVYLGAITTEAKCHYI